MISFDQVAALYALTFSTSVVLRWQPGEFSVEWHGGGAGCTERGVIPIEVMRRAAMKMAQELAQQDQAASAGFRGFWNMEDGEP